jgi:hypothetical protein
MDPLLNLPITVSRLLMIVIGLAIALIVIGMFSWPIAVLVVGFSALAVPFMILVMKAEHG